MGQVRRQASGLGRAVLAVVSGLLLSGLMAVDAFAQGHGPAMRPKAADPPVPKGPTGPAEQQFPFGATWLMDSLEGKSVSGDVPSFRLNETLRATGFGGCNAFSMSFYPVKGQKLAAGAIATTKKTCGKPLDDVERAVLIGLHSLPTWHLEANGDLTVKGQTGTMVFHRGL